MFHRFQHILLIGAVVYLTLLERSVLFVAPFEIVTRDIFYTPVVEVPCLPTSG